jgi:hypothetical protein
MGRAKPLVASRHLDPTRPLAVVAVAIFCSAFWVVVAEMVARAIR